MSSGNRLVLTRQDEALLRMLARYRIVTRQVAQWYCYPTKELNKISERLTRLTQHGITQRYDLHGKEKYFTLGRQGRRRMGAPRGWAGPLGLQSLNDWYGVLLYCCYGEEHRERLTRAELGELSPGLVQRRLSSRHYCKREIDGIEHLAFLRIDGRNADVRHIVRKCKDEMLVHLRFPIFAQYIQARRFVPTVVTATTEKARQVSALLDSTQWPMGYSPRHVVAHRPELARLYHSYPELE